MVRSFKHTILGRLGPRRGNAHVEVQVHTHTHKYIVCIAFPIQVCDHTQVHLQRVIFHSSMSQMGSRGKVRLCHSLP